MATRPWQTYFLDERVQKRNKVRYHADVDALTTTGSEGSSPTLHPL